jgi:proline dehydrogenase
MPFSFRVTLFKVLTRTILRDAAALQPPLVVAQRKRALVRLKAKYNSNTLIVHRHKIPRVRSTKHCQQKYIQNKTIE